MWTKQASSNVMFRHVRDVRHDDKEGSSFIPILMYSITRAMASEIDAIRAQQARDTFPNASTDVQQ